MLMLSGVKAVTNDIHYFSECSTADCATCSSAAVCTGCVDGKLYEGEAEEAEKCATCKKVLTCTQVNRMFLTLKGWFKNSNCGGGYFLRGQRIFTKILGGCRFYKNSRQVADFPRHSTPSNLYKSA